MEYEDLYSNCCEALPLTETNYYSDLNLVTGLCSKCKNHSHFIKGDEDE